MDGGHDCSVNPENHVPTRGWGRRRPTMTDQLTTTTAWPANDPGTYRRLPASSRPVDPAVVERLLAAEWERFTSWSGASAEHNERASPSRCRSG